MKTLENISIFDNLECKNFENSILTKKNISKFLYPEYENLVFINGKFSISFSNFSKNISIENKDFLEINVCKRLNKKIHFLHLTTNEINSNLSKIKINIEKDSKIVILQQFLNFDDNLNIFKNVFEIFLNKNSSLDHYILQNSENNFLLNSFKINIFENGLYNSFLSNFKAKISKFNFEVNLNEKLSKAFVNGIYLSKNQNILNHYFEINHLESFTESSIFIKGILKDESKAFFEVSTSISKDIKEISAKQLNKNIILDTTAKCYSKPILWIRSSDVKCSHGSTTGYLDQDAIFFLQSRGIDLLEAKKIVLSAFLKEIYEKIDLDEVKNFIDGELL
ncbi:MAG: hypothetical protein A3F40_00465 [Chlamydiae bacterium RIFCSPHIGHO2_12_FULL_27_8]|nr:MAG: hypothetical protein A3F40_00465 [Chlamydiae bacterium RIFCSPHIGHO2_12_FULL_27_8]